MPAAAQPAAQLAVGRAGESTVLAERLDQLIAVLKDLAGGRGALTINVPGAEHPRLTAREIALELRVT